MVHGTRSATGTPLLANDPHMPLLLPNLWHVAHLVAPGLEVIGATIPGVPGVWVGHNPRVAWGLTNAALDVQDLFVEEIARDDPPRVRRPEGW